MCQQKTISPGFDTRAVQAGRQWVGRSAKLISSAGENDGSLTSIVFSHSGSVLSEKNVFKWNRAPVHVWCRWVRERRKEWNENQFIHMCVFHRLNEPNKTLSFRIVLRRCSLFISQSMSKSVPNDRLRSARCCQFHYIEDAMHRWSERRNDSEHRSDFVTIR